MKRTSEPVPSILRRYLKGSWYQILGNIFVRQDRWEVFNNAKIISRRGRVFKIKAFKPLWLIFWCKKTFGFIEFSLSYHIMTSKDLIIPAFKMTKIKSLKICPALSDAFKLDHENSVCSRKQTTRNHYGNKVFLVQTLKLNLLNDYISKRQPGSLSSEKATSLKLKRICKVRSI